MNLEGGQGSFVDCVLPYMKISNGSFTFDRCVFNGSYNSSGVAIQLTDSNVKLLKLTSSWFDCGLSDGIDFNGNTVEQIVIYDSIINVADFISGVVSLKYYSTSG